MDRGDKARIDFCLTNEMQNEMFCIDDAVRQAEPISREANESLLLDESFMNQTSTKVTDSYISTKPLLQQDYNRILDNLRKSAMRNKVDRIYVTSIWFHERGQTRILEVYAQFYKFTDNQKPLKTD